MLMKKTLPLPHILITPDKAICGSLSLGIYQKRRKNFVFQYFRILSAFFDKKIDKCVADYSKRMRCLRRYQTGLHHERKIIRLIEFPAFLRFFLVVLFLGPKIDKMSPNASEKAVI